MLEQGQFYRPFYQNIYVNLSVEKKVMDTLAIARNLRKRDQETALLKSYQLHLSPIFTILHMVLLHHFSTIICRDTNLTKLGCAGILADITRAFFFFGRKCGQLPQNSPTFRRTGSSEHTSQKLQHHALNSKTKQQHSWQQNKFICLMLLSPQEHIAADDNTQPRSLNIQKHEIKMALASTRAH